MRKNHNRSVGAEDELIQAAFRRLAGRPGFIERPDQRQLALLLSDLIDQGSTGAFEAPTGLGKSLAALIPAIAHAIAHKKRTVIATYTNVLAEQYWRSDLPLALSLFAEPGNIRVEGVRTQLIMGRQRYACLLAMDEHAPEEVDLYRSRAELGNESEFRKIVKGPTRRHIQLWQKVVTPPVCPGRLCRCYDDCYYYSARRGAESAEIVITNHSVVIQDALMARANEDDEGILGTFDFLILDEAHDFPQAAANGLEFELSSPKLAALSGIASRLEYALLPLAEMCGDGAAWPKECAAFRDSVAKCDLALAEFHMIVARAGIIAATPATLFEHPQVIANKLPDGAERAKEITEKIAAVCAGFVELVTEKIQVWQDAFPERGRSASETTRNYCSYIREFAAGSSSLFQPEGIAVSYAGRSGLEPILRHDIIGLSEPLRELIWERTPYACLSATLALDGNFDFFRRSTGCEPAFEEILPTPFNYATQAALYMPPAGAIPDPTIARREGREGAYYVALAKEISQIIRVAGGKTLALFHSRKEMEGVLEHMNVPAELPIYTQSRSGAGAVGEVFISNVCASLFALRSFWTGFDAPGETLSCVVLVRVPFEVPTDPPAIARLAYLQSQGRDAFSEHTLPLAKMLMRQGAGRLIRRASDKGIVAILDSRVQTKRYGEQILANLPPEMRLFRDIRDAAGWIGLDSGLGTS